MKNKIAFTSLGCPKNLVDSEKIITQLKANGYDLVSDYGTADLEIINTCGFINEAIEESLEAIGGAIANKKKVIVTGCLGAKKELILQKFPQVLSVTGPNSLEEIIQTVKQYLPITSEHACELPATGIKLTPPHYAYLKIAEGCNQHCTYCIIPQLRGSQVSRPATEILQEAEILVKAGVKELLIIAQDTGAYGNDLAVKTNIINLVRAIHESPLQQPVWLRLHYVYPYPLVDELVELMAEKKILPYLDMPLQHANQRILKLMQRPGDYDNMLERFAKWRKICPDLTIRSTFIVGFPSETEQEFKELLDFLKAAQLDRVGCFKYSPVAGAKANEFSPQIAEEIKNERFHDFMTTQQKISKLQLAKKIGKTMPVIIDKIVGADAIGRSVGDAPEIDGQVIIKNCKTKTGDIVNVKITGADEYDLFGDQV
jgi:ribosomal protein S12 methylthiotransferase